MLPAPAATRYMPIDELKPGMVGIGRTAFQGTTLEEFKVHIIGVLRNNVGPQRDLILARLEGGPLAKTGVIAGMSGSPVFIDGRMVGAVSYQLGQFPTEPIAGITPIAEMMQATFPSGAPATSRGAVRIPADADAPTLWRSFERAVTAVVPFMPPAADLARLSLGLGAGTTGLSLRPIAVPLALSGFDPTATEPALRIFERGGFVAVPGAAPRSAQSDAPAAPLRPGDPIGIQLIGGDMEFGATGTVTEVADGRVYAFGHPLYNLGPTRFVMTRAYVHTVLPSLATSMKLASMGDPIGTFQQDRSAAIAGTLGPLPARIKVTVRLQREGRPPRTMTLLVADDTMLTPLLTYTALANIVTAHERDYGSSTYAVRGTATIAGHVPLEFDDVYVGEQPGISAAAAVVAPIGALLTNDRERPTIESIDLAIDTAERLRVTSVERVWIDAPSVRRGKTVPVKIQLRTYREESIIRTVPVEIPLQGDGPFTLFVGSGPALAQFEQVRPASSPDSVDEMIRHMNRTRRNNRLYVRLMARDMGATVNGATLPSLPSSVLAVVQGDRGGSATSGLQPQVVGAWDFPLGMAVTGMRTLIITPDFPEPQPRP
jgi:hypothetical protein